MADYNSNYTGAQIDSAIAQVIAGGISVVRTMPTEPNYDAVKIVYVENTHAQETQYYGYVYFFYPPTPDLWLLDNDLSGFYTLFSQGWAIDFRSNATVEFKSLKAITGGIYYSTTTTVDPTDTEHTTKVYDANTGWIAQAYRGLRFYSPVTDTNLLAALTACGHRTNP